MRIKKEEIERYLIEVKNSIKNDRYRIEFNTKRIDNINLFRKYLIDESISKRILLSLEVDDFSVILNNTHKGFEHEKLYVFGKDVKLIERIDGSINNVSLYIKFNKLEDSFLIVISMHEQHFPMEYYFK